MPIPYAARGPSFLARPTRTPQSTTPPPHVETVASVDTRGRASSAVPKPPLEEVWRTHGRSDYSNHHASVLSTHFLGDFLDQLPRSVCATG